MTVAAAYLGGTWRLPIQLGALYCLFTVYMYQIEEPKIKVRFLIHSLACLLIEGRIFLWDRFESPSIRGTLFLTK